MDGSRNPQVKLHEAAAQALEALHDGVIREGLPRETTRRDILSALVLYTTPQQAVGMLAAYWRHIAPVIPEEDGDGKAEASSRSS